MRISDWSSDVCSSDLLPCPPGPACKHRRQRSDLQGRQYSRPTSACPLHADPATAHRHHIERPACRSAPQNSRSEEHTSELQSLMRISYAVFCLKKKTTNILQTNNNNTLSILHYYTIYH